MARFLIGTIPVAGHVSPALPIARKLVERGHEVRWYTGKLFQSIVEETGAHYTPIVTGFDLSNPESIPPHLLEERENLQKLAQLKFDIKHFFCEPAIAQVKDLSNILRDFPADVLLSDFCFLGADWVYEKGGPPWAGFGVSTLPFSSSDTAPFGLGIQPNNSLFGWLRNSCLNWAFNWLLLRDTTIGIDTARSHVGLPPCRKGFFDLGLSPFLYLQGTVPAFEYPRRDLPSQIHFVGPFLPDPPASFIPPAWWDDLDSKRPVVHVTQGTVATKADELIIPSLQALAEEDVLVVATTGGQPIESIKLNPLPTNARIERFIPYYHLLPHVNVMITNGGYNGVQMALANGIPIVAAGQTEDKPEVCARIEWSGVGINLKTRTPKPNQIKDAVKKILASPHYRQKAQFFQAEIARYDAPTEAAILLERLAATKQPVVKKPF